MENLGEVRKKLVLDVLRQDPNTIEVDKHREIRRCYNYGEIDHLAARYSKPRKEKKKEVRITEEIIEDFSLGRK